MASSQRKVVNGRVFLLFIQKKRLKNLKRSESRQKKEVGLKVWRRSTTSESESSKSTKKRKSRISSFWKRNIFIARNYSSLVEIEMAMGCLISFPTVLWKIRHRQFRRRIISMVRSRRIHTDQCLRL